MMGHLWFARCILLIIITYYEVNTRAQTDGAHLVHANEEGCLGFFETIENGDMTNVRKNLRLVTNSSANAGVVFNGDSFS